MADTNASGSVSISRLILVPGLISLGVTILRLVGELQHWPKLFFNPAPGGGGGLVAIVWLVPVFGVYFALKLAKALLAYAYAARVPVLIVMYFALSGNWGTHYDGLPPDIPEMSFWPKFIGVGVAPQLVFWVMFTVVIGALAGGITAAVVRGAKAPAQATS